MSKVRDIVHALEMAGPEHAHAVLPSLLAAAVKRHVPDLRAALSAIVNAVIRLMPLAGGLTDWQRAATKEVNANMKYDVLALIQAVHISTELDIRTVSDRLTNLENMCPDSANLAPDVKWLLSLPRMHEKLKAQLDGFQTPFDYDRRNLDKTVECITSSVEN